ncbi:glycerol kinase GlpK [Spiroplasma endosymbiont of Crioceris asparagi]|uniref:glycerol kinase GlpK n=1 Tax=Spiroplasma endosymbiont of Crioceris asparagi TaxID=3066286 RepID=UPI0030D5FA9B
MKKYVITLDEGTTSARTVVVDKSGKIVSINQVEFTQFFPQAGWVEHDALEIWNSQRTTLVNAINNLGITSKDIECIGITNQRETTIVWDRETGNPIYNAIVWQDKRLDNYFVNFSQKEYDLLRQKTGLIPNAYFSVSKLAWILDNVKGAREKAEKGQLMFGTVNTWLIYRLTGQKVFATDHTNAQRTLLYNIHKNDWDDELLKLFNIPKSLLPEIKECADDYGLTFPNLLSKKDDGEIQINSSIGDQQSALYGQMCINTGEVKSTYGTGCFILMNTGTEKIFSEHGILTTVALAKDNKITYALEGSVMIAGAVTKWLKENLKIIYDYEEAEWYLEKVKDNREVYFVPSFSGLGSPYWDDSSRGAIFGLDRGTKREHIIRAAIESIAYQANDVIEAMKKDLKKDIKIIKVDGGATRSNYLMQFQASISKTNVLRPKNIETTAMGAAYLAGLRSGFWKDETEIKNIIKEGFEFKPNMSEEVANKKIKGWKSAVSRTFSWLVDTN